ncbi:MAG: transglycosylase SLT domain-containing protein [Prevotella sp.]
MGKLFVFILVIISLISCGKKREEKVYTPWGTPITTGGEMTADTVSGNITLDDIISQGEMIMLTKSGPETYYDYKGHGMGVHYLLCERFTEKIGVKLRVETCKDSTEMIERLARGEGDIIACPIARQEGTAECGPGWLVAEDNTSLLEAIRRWYKPEMLEETASREKSLLATGGVVRHVYAPMINRQKGLISKWDNLFQKHAPTARLDWRLLAAQCYQESCFDPRARSWAGACGLMQIMPSTAKILGLAIDDIYKPEPNIAAASRYMSLLMAEFRDIPTQQDRICFALASYNGGKNHIRDAMALTAKYGCNPNSWNDVQEFVLKLTKAEYYTDNVVRYGYMRGTETTDYVNRIMRRWREYGGRPGRMAPQSPGLYNGPSTQPSISGGNVTPRPAKKTNRYKL